MNGIIHVGSVQDGAIINFPFSARFFVKVCQRSTGLGGVVDITDGEYIPYNELDKYGLGHYVKVIADNLEDFVTEED